MTCDLCAIPFNAYHTFHRRMQCINCGKVSVLTLTTIHVELKDGEHRFSLVSPVPCSNCGDLRLNVVADCGHGWPVTNWPVKKKVRK